MQAFLRLRPAWRQLLVVAFCFTAPQLRAQSQTLSLPAAIDSALHNYGTIKAKANYAKAAQSGIKVATVDYLPTATVAAEQAYGTVNGQFGPQFALGGINAAAAGPPFPNQHWTAAFGSLYLASMNWDFYTFGRVRAKVKLAEAEALRQQNDLEQEKFQQQIRVAGAYLNLLAAQRLRRSQENNLERALEVKAVVTVRTRNGLNAGVDSSLANAEVSNATIALNNARDVEQQQSYQLAVLMGVPYQNFSLDTLFLSSIPKALIDTVNINNNPILQYFQSRITLSTQQEKYLDRLKYPALSLVGALQTRGSGFDYNYSEAHPDAYSQAYWNGIKPARTNFLVGVGVSWNLTNIKRANAQLVAQQWTSRGLQDEYDLVNQQLQAQMALAEQKIQNALHNYTEVPVQLKAAGDAFLQKSVLYKNGLTNIVDLTQARYALNRAETDRDIAISNIWQGILLKAAASGDFSLFMNAFQ